VLSKIRFVPKFTALTESFLMQTTEPPSDASDAERALFHANSLQTVFTHMEMVDQGAELLAANTAAHAAMSYAEPAAALAPHSRTNRSNCPEKRRSLRETSGNRERDKKHKSNDMRCEICHHRCRTPLNRFEPTQLSQRCHQLSHSPTSPLTTWS
jgi:hypothetical protein